MEDCVVCGNNINNNRRGNVHVIILEELETSALRRPPTWNVPRRSCCDAKKWRLSVLVSNPTRFLQKELTAFISRVFGVISHREVEVEGTSAFVKSVHTKRYHCNTRITRATITTHYRGREIHFRLDFSSSHLLMSCFAIIFIRSLLFDHAAMFTYMVVPCSLCASALNRVVLLLSTSSSRTTPCPSGLLPDNVR